MKTLHLRALVVAVLAAPLSAFAHPGHEGDHDFAWTFSHLIDHPLATLGCLGLISLGAFIAWRIASRAENPRNRQPEPQRK